MVARSSAARGRWGRVGQCDERASGSGTTGRGHCGPWRWDMGSRERELGRGAAGVEDQSVISDAGAGITAAGEKNN